MQETFCICLCKGNVFHAFPVVQCVFFFLHNRYFTYENKILASTLYFLIGQHALKENPQIYMGSNSCLNFFIYKDCYFPFTGKCVQQIPMYQLISFFSLLMQIFQLNSRAIVKRNNLKLQQLPNITRVSSASYIRSQILQVL